MPKMQDLPIRIAILGSVKLSVQGCGLTECANPVEDEVFEEEESAESEGGLARPCHPDGGGGFSPQSGAPAAA